MTDSYSDPLTVHRVLKKALREADEIAETGVLPSGYVLARNEPSNRYASAYGWLEHGIRQVLRGIESEMDDTPELIEYDPISPITADDYDAARGR